MCHKYYFHLKQELKNFDFYANFFLTKIVKKSDTTYSDAGLIYSRSFNSFRIERLLGRLLCPTLPK
jgi:hypothetical protein